MKLNLKIVRRLNVAAAGILSGLYFFENKYYLKEIKNKVELKIGGIPSPVSRKLNTLVEDVMNDMGLSNEDRSLVNIFVVNDFNVQHFGHINKNFGAFLGVPQHFIFDRIIDLDIRPMISSGSLSLDPEEVQNFITFLSLSTEAKKFAIARELYEAKSTCFFSIGLLPLLVFFCGNIISIIGEKILKHARKPLPYFHGIVFFKTTWFYVLLNDLVTVDRQGNSERYTAKLGRAYINGGIEYYEKVLKRNETIKKLNESAPFTHSGEYKMYMGFRTIIMPFRRRIELLEKLKQKETSYM